MEDLMCGFCSKGSLIGRDQWKSLAFNTSLVGPDRSHNYVDQTRRDELIATLRNELPRNG
jgi:hypothetical protein